MLSGCGDPGSEYSWVVLHLGRSRFSLLLLGFVLVAASCTSTTTSVAEEPTPQSPNEPGELVLLSAEEIGHELLGNTIIGNWRGEDYRQFFDESGITTYRAADSERDSVGTWRVNVRTGLYESLWNDVEQWDEYEVRSDGETWFWTGGGVELSPFTIVEGNQLGQ